MGRFVRTAESGAVYEGVLAIAESNLLAYRGLRLADYPPFAEAPVESWRYIYVKRAFDFCSALIMIFMFAIPGLLIATAILLTSEGPIFYREQRIGRDGRPFRIWKFRSMYQNAENFVNFQFHSQGVNDVLKLMQATGTKENAWARQVFSFWENAASLVLNDIVHPGLFFAWNGEMVFVYAKFKPFLKELRQKMENPAFLAGVEKVVSNSPEMRKRVDMIQKRLAKMAEKAQADKS